MTPAHPARCVPLLLALALACAGPASLAAQNRDSIPQGQQPPTRQPPTIARPPAQQPPAEQPPTAQPPADQPAQEPETPQGTTTATGRRRREPVTPPTINVPTLPGTGDPPSAGVPGVRLPRLPGRRQQPAPPTAVQVPSLAGRTVEEARAILSAARLTLGEVSELPVERPAGTVFMQTPAAGRTAAPGEAVSVTIARAPAAAPARTVVVPRIMDLPLDQAAGRLRAAGLRVGEVGGASGPAARVAAHTYRAGETVPLGAEVNLSLAVPAPAVAARPAETEPARVDSLAVPDVRTLRLADARTALERAGLGVAFDPALADSAAWTVAAQAPDAGARVPAGSAVQLALAGPAPIAVVAPPVVAAGLQPAPTTPPPPPVADGERGRAKLWIALAVALLAAAAAGAWRMRAGKAAPPVTGVRVALRTEVEPRATVSGPPLGAPGLRLRLRPGAPVARIEAAGPLFRAKGGAG